MCGHATSEGASSITGIEGSSDGTGVTDGTVGSLGEFGLIRAVTQAFSQGSHVELGPGDDAAVVAVGGGRVVATTDLLVEGVHFRRDWSTALDVGHKAAAQNLSDIAAMGARPTALLVGLATPPELPVDWAIDLAHGLTQECELLGASVVGGDVVRSKVLTLAITALGELDGRAPVTRAGASEGDVVAVCGRLGWAAAGLAVLSRGFRSPRRLADAHRRPAPPYAAGVAAAVAGATAMCDVSDGLLADLGHLARSSAVSIDLDPTVAALQPDPPLAEIAPALGLDPWTWVLTGGEDHALVATFPTYEAMAAAGLDWHPIGRVLAQGAGSTITLAGEQPDLDTKGHDHFA